MDLNEYKPNSHRSKTENTSVPEKKVNPVVTSGVKIKKKSEVSKFKDVFIAEDISNVKSYIFSDVIVPTIKKAILDSVDMLLNGRVSGGKQRGTSYVSYSSISNRNTRRDDYRDSRNSRFDLDDITITSRGEAEEVLDQMGELIDRYGVVTVADLYDMIKEPAPYTANRYGWTTIRSAEVIRVRDGYMLKLLPPKPID